jgi:hypothetical protein
VLIVCSLLSGGVVVVAAQSISIRELSIRAMATYSVMHDYPNDAVRYRAQRASVAELECDTGNLLEGIHGLPDLRGHCRRVSRPNGQAYREVYYSLLMFSRRAMARS